MENLSVYEAMAKLRFNDSERNIALKCAEFLTESFNELEKVHTEGVSPLVTVLDTSNVLREDAASKLITREELLSNAPEQYNGYFQVPKTLEG